MSVRDELAGELEHWKSFLLTTSAEMFFQIMRTYLGDVQTPFNKHELIDRLASFLRKSETRERILSLIDGSDALVLSAVYYLGAPTLSRLYALLESDILYLKLHYHVLNLEERLLLYRDKEDTRMRLRINPLLLDALLGTYINPSHIFPTGRRIDSDKGLPWLTDSRVLAITAYMHGAKSLFKSNGELRKRARADLCELFGHDGDSVRRTDLLLSSLVGCGVFHIRQDEIELDPDRWMQLCRLGRDDRRAYVAAGAVVRRHQELSLTETATTIAGFLSSLPGDRVVGKAIMRRVLRAKAVTDLPEPVIEELFDVLAGLGLIRRIDDEGYSAGADPPERSAGEAVVVQPNFELHLPISIDAGDASIVPITAKLGSFDIISYYEITRASFARALETGLSRESIEEELAELTGRPLPTNVTTTTEAWEHEHRSIRIVEGTVVTVNEGRRHLFEHDSEIRELIEEVLSPGVYLVRTAHIQPLTERLARAGIHSVPKPERAGDNAASNRGNREALAALVPTGNPILESDEAPELDFEKTRYKKEIEQTAKELDLPAELQDELSDRIGRKLILFPEQVREMRFGGDIVEVKGFDYLGKVRLAEQALSSRDDLLEIIDTDEGGAPERLLIRPEALEQSGSELILIGKRLPGEEEVRKRIRSIGLLKKRKGSLLT